jgi:hypothetical protein
MKIYRLGFSPNHHHVLAKASWIYSFPTHHGLKAMAIHPEIPYLSGFPRRKEVEARPGAEP